MSPSHKHEDTTIVDFPDLEAKFPGGASELMKFITSNLVYPDFIEDIDVQGRLYFSFVVEKDGSLTDIKVERGTGSGYGDDLLEFMHKMPKWTPAEVNGKIVRSRCRLPILLCPLH